MTQPQQQVAVIGAAGQVGAPLTRQLLRSGHRVRLLIRRLHDDNREILNEFVRQGASLVEVSDMQDVKAMTRALDGVQTLVCAVPGSKAILTEHEPRWLEAAIAAGVKRFVPTEFGAHTKALEWGLGEVFDHKKRFQQLLFASGLEWTLIYTGGIFDYFLPNLRFFHKITTFGDMELPIHTHNIEDIGRIAALAATDERTGNRCVQLDFNALTQARMLELLKRSFPDTEFEYQHYSSDYITDALKHAGDEITAKQGAETDRERWGINQVVYVEGRLAAFTEDTLSAQKLYPEYRVVQTPEAALADPQFVFER